MILQQIIYKWTTLPYIVKNMKNDVLNEFWERKLWTNGHKETKRNYEIFIRQYFKIIKKDPNTYFNKQNDYTKDIRKYFIFEQKNTRKSQRLAIAAIKSFLKTMAPETKHLDIWDTLREELKGAKPTSDEYVPDYHEIKKILNYCDLRIRAAVLVAASSGIRIKELVSIEKRDVHFDETPVRINIREEITKNRQPRTTFITPEAAEVLQQWMDEKEPYLKDCHKSMNFPNAVKIDYLNDPRIFPFHMNAIRNGFHSAARKAGYDSVTKFRGDKGKEIVRERMSLHFHCLRKSFRQYLGKTDLAEELMGHSGYLSGEYRDKKDRKKLAADYLQYMDNVSVYETAPDLTEVNEKLQEMGKMQELIDKMQTKIQLLEMKLDIEKVKNGTQK